jgi:hypothetical protein
MIVPILHESCRKVTRMMLDSERRKLAWHERLALRLHVMACDNCNRFRRQNEVIRTALARWRARGDEPGDGASEE